MEESTEIALLRQQRSRLRERLESRKKKSALLVAAADGVAALPFAAVEGGEGASAGAAADVAAAAAALGLEAVVAPDLYGAQVGDEILGTESSEKTDFSSAGEKVPGSEGGDARGDDNPALSTKRRRSSSIAPGLGKSGSGTFRETAVDGEVSRGGMQAEPDEPEEGPKKAQTSRMARSISRTGESIGGGSESGGMRRSGSGREWATREGKESGRRLDSVSGQEEGMEGSREGGEKARPMAEREPSIRVLKRLIAACLMSADSTLPMDSSAIHRRLRKDPNLTPGERATAEEVGGEAGPVAGIEKALNLMAKGSGSGSGSGGTGPPTVEVEEFVVAGVARLMVLAFDRRRLTDEFPTLLGGVPSRRDGSGGGSSGSAAAGQAEQQHERDEHGLIEAGVGGGRLGASRAGRLGSVARQASMEPGAASEARRVEQYDDQAAPAAAGGSQMLLHPRESTPFPLREQTPFPLREHTPFPLRDQTPFPMRENTPFPFRDGTPFPMMRDSTPFPMRDSTPFPFRDSTPFYPRESTPFGQRALTPFDHQTGPYPPYPGGGGRGGGGGYPQYGGRGMPGPPGGPHMGGGPGPPGYFGQHGEGGGFAPGFGPEFPPPGAMGGPHVAPAPGLGVGAAAAGMGPPGAPLQQGQQQGGAAAAAGASAGTGAGGPPKGVEKKSSKALAREAAKAEGGGGVGGEGEEDDEESLEAILSKKSFKEKQQSKRGEELLELLQKPTAKESAVAAKFKTKGGSMVKEYCSHLTKEDCVRILGSYTACDKVHFRRIIAPHTEIELGDCSFLDRCRHMKTCKYVHYEVDPTSDPTRMLMMPPHGGPGMPPFWDGVGPMPYRGGPLPQQEVNPFHPPSRFERPPRPEYCSQLELGECQWINCDIRNFRLDILGQFGVIMADPPWDIHMELPYGTMSDDEMRSLNVQVLQTDGLIFLWVTGRAMELGRECLELWGYRRVEEIIWVKTNQLQRVIRTGRTGHWLNHSKEHCLVGIKGNPIVNRNIDTDVLVAEVRETSRKPDEMYSLIERISPRTRKIELFARMHNTHAGWISLGNQLDGVRLLDRDIRARFCSVYPGIDIQPPEEELEAAEKMSCS